MEGIDMPLYSAAEHGAICYRCGVEFIKPFGKRTYCKHCRKRFAMILSDKADDCDETLKMLDKDDPARDLVIEERDALEAGAEMMEDT
jgi:hypothetical protein